MMVGNDEVGVDVIGEVEGIDNALQYTKCSLSELTPKLFCAELNVSQ